MSEIFGDNNEEDYPDNDVHNGDVHDGDDDNDDLDDVTIARLKQIKVTQVRHITEHNVDTEALNKILKSPSFKVKDLVK